MLIPDSQHVIDTYQTNRWKNTILWIETNRAALNLAAAIHVGDCVDDVNTNSQWAMLMEGLNLNTNTPLVINEGNHDIDTPFNPRRHTQFNARITREFYTNKSWFSGGFYTNTEQQNMYLLVTNGSTKLLIFAFELQIPAVYCDWATNICAQYPDHQVIFSTHLFLQNDGTKYPVADLQFPSSLSAVEIWNRVKRVKNLRLFASGHYICTPTVARSFDVGTAGNWVDEIMVNWQCINDAGGPVSKLMVLTFHPGNDSIATKVYDVGAGAYEGRLGLSYPPQSAQYLTFSSSATQGTVGFNQTGTLAGAGNGMGHLITSSNAYPAGSIAPYYLTGRERPPQTTSVDATAQASAVAGFSNFTAAVQSLGLVLGDFKFNYGQRGTNYTQTWNLETDTFDTDYWLSPASTVEERVYRAQPDQVEMLITYQNTPWIYLSYSPLFWTVDYTSVSALDDVTKCFSNPMRATPASNLSGAALATAQAFLQDLGNGGFLQARFDGIQPAAQQTFLKGFEGGNYSFTGKLQLVSVPTLRMSPQTNGLALTWDASWDGYQLQTSSSFDGPWRRVGTTVNRMIITPSEQIRLFRLHTRF
ncbi:MAG: hypothetical protein ACTHLW_15600 [Verrucomicrobiota bacterium]